MEVERQKRRARGIEDDEENEEDAENEDVEEPVEEEEEEYVYHDPGEIVRGFYRGESGNFWLLLVSDACQSKYCNDVTTR